MAELLLTKLKANAASTPDKLLFEFCGDDGSVLGKFTYGEFEQRTRLLALKLMQRVGYTHGSTTAMLVYPPGLDFIVAFVACLRAGIVAVPVYPPRGAKNKDLAMFLAVHSSCKATLALTNSAYNWATKVLAMKDTLSGMFSSRSNADEALGQWPDTLEWIVTNNTDAVSAPSSLEALDQANADTVAFLQYTSGSTSLPKGVVLTHGNLAHNLSTIMVALKADQTVRVVSWLPMYHDMGLIGSHLGTIYCGGSATIFSPLSFVKNPPLWIELASSRRATHLQAPNFAYRLTVRKFNNYTAKAPIDLSSVRHVFNAAEPIDPASMDEFLQVFGQFGLRKEAMVPGYGLAEHTVYVCDGGRQRLVVSRRILEEENRCEFLEASSSPEAMTLVGCGWPPPSSDIEILIVDPHSRRPVQDDFVGEIWISSPSKSRAYFGLEEKTQSDLHARLFVVEEEEETKTKKDETTQDSAVLLQVRAVEQTRFASASESQMRKEWLRTGDLGVVHSQELFICGRIKDLLIVRGRNHFPQDLEATVERVDRTRIRPGCSAAFTIVPSKQKSGEVVVVCAEVRPNSSEDLAKVIAGIRVAVAREHGVSVHAVSLLQEHSIPKTTSGKISRHRVKAAFLAGTLKSVEAWMSGDLDAVDDVALAEEEAEGPVGHTGGTVITKLQGDELLQKLKYEAGSLLEHDPVTMDADVPLVELGFDSMMLTQFKSAVINTLGAELPDEQLFEEKCTLNKVRMMIEDMAELQTRGGAPISATAADAVTGDAPVPIRKPAKKKKQPFFGTWRSGQKCGFCGC